ncbi:dienelactone hydrolase family protein [Fictibacillus sp. BK138]|uniref:dienelactone hydrolase family protein n=1 Tax=Fictibacillus sp. BK138 TaxID=2512121 RepID=UPI00102892D8|nr:dienelactone hydrolase family protein [Fictibacillus sp. BK138]RZT23576.1 dienelactone hydrolase [Fictibacillus sp. BK138]
MIQIHNDSRTLVLVIHEIYGINQHMHDFCKLLSDHSLDVICPNLVERDTPFDYSQEEAAYRNFMENVGFGYATQKIKDILSDSKDKYEKIYIIGFSVGATVAWLCSEDDCVTGVVGYYGSRIRNYVDLTPQCPTILFFPQEEQSFDVEDLISTLDKKNIEIHKFNGKHGFSDPYSPNYNGESAEKAFSKMVRFIR